MIYLIIGFFDDKYRMWYEVRETDSYLEAIDIKNQWKKHDDIQYVSIYEAKEVE